MKQNAHGMEAMIAWQDSDAVLGLSRKEVSVLWKKVDDGGIDALECDGTYTVVGRGKCIDRGDAKQHDPLFIA